jgi:transposase
VFYALENLTSTRAQRNTQPDYNPIEKSWANMKRFLGNNLRGFQSLDSAILSFFHLPKY